MAINYPTSLDSFSDKTDNVDDVMAVDINNVQDGVEALETKMGVNSSAVVGSVDNFLGGMTLTDHGVLLGSGTGAITPTTVMTDGQLLIGQSAADPLPKTVSGDATLSAAGAITISNNGVSQAKLKTTIGSVNTGSTALFNLTLPGGEYGFYPQTKATDGGDPTFASIRNSNGVLSYATNIALKTTNGTGYAYAQQRYVQASGEVHWVFFLRDKATGKIVSGFQAPDHPCFGNGGDPARMPHPFPSTDLLTQEILVIALDPIEIKAMKAQDPNKDLLEIVAEKYIIDEKAIPFWPDQPVTVGLPLDWDEAWLERTPIIPIKKVIPKPEGVKIVSLKAKVV